MAKRLPQSPRPGRTLLDGVFKRSGLDREAREWRALYAWHRLCGPRLGRHARAERILGTTLLVRVATSAWANELSYLRADLLARLRADAHADWVSELRFTIGPFDGLPAWDDEPALPPPPRGAHPPIDAGRVAQALLQVTDPELRAALAELFARAQAASSDG